MTRRNTTRTPRTFRDPRNVISREQLRRELAGPTDELTDFVYYDLQQQSHAPNRSIHLQGMRRALVAGLERHIRYVARNPPAASQVLPQDMAVALVQALRLVNGGEPASLFTPRPLPGGRGNLRSAARQESVDLAVRYITAARMNWLSDVAPIRTVATAYRVSSRQVARWLATAGKPRARETATRNWAHSLGLRPYSDRKAGRALKKLVATVGGRYRLADHAS